MILSNDYNELLEEIQFLEQQYQREWVELALEEWYNIENNLIEEIEEC